MATFKSLQEALKEILQDDDKVSKYEASVLREIILSDGRVSAEEQHFLEEALRSNKLDDNAVRILRDVLLRKEARI